MYTSLKLTKLCLKFILYKKSVFNSHKKWCSNMKWVKYSRSLIDMKTDEQNLPGLPGFKIFIKESGNVKPEMDFIENASQFCVSNDVIRFRKSK